MKVSRLNERAFEQREARGTRNPSSGRTVTPRRDHSATHSPVPLRTRRRVRLLVVVPGPVSRRAWSGRWSLGTTYAHPDSGPRRAACRAQTCTKPERADPSAASEAAREPGSDALKASGPALRKNRFQTTPASRGLPGAPIFFITRGVDAPRPAARRAGDAEPRGGYLCNVYDIYCSPLTTQPPSLYTFIYSNCPSFDRIASRYPRFGVASAAAAAAPVRYFLPRGAGRRMVNCLEYRCQFV